MTSLQNFAHCTVGLHSTVQSAMQARRKVKKIWGATSNVAGLSSLGVPSVPWHTQILADQLTLFQPGGTDYAHLITTGTPGFSELPTALSNRVSIDI